MQRTTIETPGGEVADGFTGPLKGDPRGIVSYTEPRRQYVGFASQLTDSTGSQEMAIDASISGTPDRAYLVEPTTNWTTSAISGVWDFESSTHCVCAVITVVDYTLLAGDTVTIGGTGITPTTVTEGVEWTAATSNDATATSLASAISAVAGVSAVAESAVVIIDADEFADITTLTSSDGTNLPVQLESIDGTATVDGDQFQLERSSSVDLSSFASFSGFVYLTSFNDSKHAINMQVQLAGVPVGTSVDVTDFINTGLLDVWQRFVIPKGDSGLNGSTIDQIIFTSTSTTGAPANFWLDCINIEEIGGVLFSFTPPTGGVFELFSVNIALLDNITTVEPDQIMSVPALTNGIVIRTQVNNRVLFSAGFKSFNDLYATGIRKDSEIIGTSSTSVNMIIDNPGVLPQLKGDTGDSYSFLLSDDLSSMTSFKAILRGRLIA